LTLAPPYHPFSAQVSRARADLERVVAAHEARASADAATEESRRALFAKLTSASVNAANVTAARARKAAKEVSLALTHA
jgi:hypothetical protein